MAEKEDGTVTHSDELVERVARAICEATSGPFEMLDDTGRDALRCEARAALSALPGHELLREALRIIAAHEVVAPLTQNDDNVSLSDLPFYVAGKAHAELAILHNIARNALDAYEVGATAEKLRAELEVG